MGTYQIEANALLYPNFRTFDKKDVLSMAKSYRLLSIEYGHYPLSTTNCFARNLLNL